MARRYEYNCEGIYGLTGSGKTTFAMMRAFEFCLKGHHIYTNIDFNIGALRHYLLRREGFKWRDDQGNIPRLHRLWHRIEDDQVGEFWRHTTRGPAVVMIDEAQLWFPQTKQQHGENEDFVKYLTQHRKLRHHVWFLSQYPTLVSHSFRKNQHIHWDVRNSRHMAMNLVFATVRVPFEGFAYSGFYRDINGERVDNKIIWAFLPQNKWLWDLFDSRELHAGLADLIKQGDACTSTSDRPPPEPSSAGSGAASSPSPLLSSP